MSKDKLFFNISQLMTGRGFLKKQGRKVTEKDLSVIKNGAFVVRNNQIIWIGKKDKVPREFSKAKKVDLNGKNVFPGFVDCHTHMVFAGDRQNEFELRNSGITYQEIAQKGGGILSTVKATRKIKNDDLRGLSQQRVQAHLKQGVTTIEIKSGYGLSRKSEEKMLQVAQELKGARITTTFLGAHAIPQEFSSEFEYLKQLKKDLLEIKKKGLSQRVDIFVEKGYFSVKEAKDYLQYAKDLGFQITIHADQLNRTGATKLGLELGAQSLDHVICLNRSDKKALSQSETVAVLLPAADFYLECEYPDARYLIDSGAITALATDYNPGSSPTQNIQFVGLLARLKMKMSLPEVFSAFTYGGAKALGKEKEIGILQKGYNADFFISDQTWDKFFYNLEEEMVSKVYVGGVLKS